MSIKDLATELSITGDISNNSRFKCIAGGHTGGHDSSVFIDTQNPTFAYKMYTGFGLGTIREYHALHTKYAKILEGANLVSLPRSRVRTPLGTISECRVTVLSLEDSEIERRRVGSKVYTFTKIPMVHGETFGEIYRGTKRSVLDNLHTIYDNVMSRLMEVGVPIEGSIGNGIWRNNALAANNVKFIVDGTYGKCIVTDIGSSIRGAIRLERNK